MAPELFSSHAYRLNAATNHPSAGLILQLLSVSRKLSAPIEEVWAITSSFGSIQAWMPHMTRVAVRGAGVGAVRTVTSALGIAHEELIILEPAIYRVRYKITGPAVENIAGLIGGTDLTSVSEESTLILWVAEAAAVAGDLPSLQEGLKQFVETSIAGLARVIGAKMTET